MPYTPPMDLTPLVLAKIGRAIRENGWRPLGTYRCGCNPERLCAHHAHQRAVEHYHPETIR